METIIRIKKNKLAFRALILLAKELEKNDHTSISISEEIKEKGEMDLISPTGNPMDTFLLFDQLADFPTVDELKNIA